MIFICGVQLVLFIHSVSNIINTECPINLSNQESSADMGTLTFNPVAVEMYSILYWIYHVSYNSAVDFFYPAFTTNLPLIICAGQGYYLRLCQYQLSLTIFRDQSNFIDFLHFFKTNPY